MIVSPAETKDEEEDFFDLVPAKIDSWSYNVLQLQEWVKISVLHNWQRGCKYDRQ